MEKKICPWCGKEMTFYREVGYTCHCSENIAMIDDEYTKSIMFTSESVDDIIEMKAKHVKLKEENYQLKSKINMGDNLLNKTLQEKTEFWKKIEDENIKLKHKVLEIKAENENCNRGFELFLERYNGIIEKWVSLRAEAERTRWHSVKEEGLPTEEDMYAVTFAGVNKPTALDFDGKYFFEYDDEGTRHTFNEYIIAWAELPQAYKEE